MDALIVMLALVALAAAALLWGSDSRDVHAGCRPRRWFVELDGRALEDADQVRGRRVSGARRASHRVAAETGRPFLRLLYSRR